MIVSWNWLQEYVAPDADHDEVTRRLMMAGLNHEGTETVESDFAIDLEVTSNRPDCLGHLGVAREIAVLLDTPLKATVPKPKSGSDSVDKLAKVRIDCPELCQRYTARVIKNIKIGPSPDWMVRRLEAIGIAVINNVVDITNYVLFECGQPLHAFDLEKLNGGEIIVREARDGEEFLAIDHRTYKLERGMCVIADRDRAVALGGVMGGAESEISDTTTDLLIESAEFSPLSIRTTARKLNLHSPSSYRFERGVDPEAIRWANDRCCELILELAGGELAEGTIDVGQSKQERAPITLRLDQIPRVLGIDVKTEEVERILEKLGNRVVESQADKIVVHAPSWRRDLTREIDLIEEVARIHGYEQIPEDIAVPMWPSHRSERDRVVERLQDAVLTAGFDEAVTASIVPPQWSESFSPWTENDPIVSHTPMKGILADAPKDLGQADLARRSLIPSLLEARRYNESVSNADAALFEFAKVYLPQGAKLPAEWWMLGLVGGADFFVLKGVLESLLDALHLNQPGASNTVKKWQIASYEHPFFERQTGCELSLDNMVCGYLGIISTAAQQQFGLRAAVPVAEVRLDALQSVANLIPQYTPPSPYPTTARDLNLIVDESLRWADLAATVREVGGARLESLEYQETYRDPKKDGPEKKRLLFSFTLRAADRTLTSEEADELRDQIVARCRQEHAAELLK